MAKPAAGGFLRRSVWWRWRGAGTPAREMLARAVASPVRATRPLEAPVSAVREPPERCTWPQWGRRARWMAWTVS
jgi:hypothetical protein